MALPRVLLIGRIKEDAYVSALQKRCTVLIASSGKQGVSMVEAQPPQLIILDAASMRTPGERLARQLRDLFPKIPILHIYPADHILTDTPADALLKAPFTPRKLVNTAQRLLKSKGDKIIECGPFSMNISRRILTAHGQETQLTPKLALLVEAFLRTPNTTLDRKMLMETIWKTDYLGDTRTLDVHIRWIRKALEANGTHPRYLNTVRGIGYRLDIPTINGAHPEAGVKSKTKNRS
jgi:DNA-binding response OmpR family regulator